MIKDRLENSNLYHNLSENLSKGFSWLQKNDLKNLKDGKYDIDGNKIYASIQTYETKEDAKYEAHRKYIDIQAPLTGKECIGLALMDMAALSLPFDIDKDCVMYDGSSKPMILSPGTFAIFFPPYCAHAPGCMAPNGPEKIKKVVIKVLAE